MKLLLILLLSASLAQAAPKFTVEPVKGRLTASWKGDPAPVALDQAPTDEDIAALAGNADLEVISLSGASTFTGKGFAALKDLAKLREIQFNGTGPERFSEVFPPGSTKGYTALAELDQVEKLAFGHVMLSTEGVEILLRGMTGLKELMAGVRADDRILAAAAEAPALESLGFGHWATVPDASLTSAGLDHYARMKHLVSLGTGAKLPADGGAQALVEAVARAKGLQSLTLSFGGSDRKEAPPEITAADLAPLTALTSLERLMLTNCRLAEGSLEPLGKISTLKSISTRDAQLPAADQASLKASRPDLTVRGS